MLHSTGWLTGASTQERTFPGKYAAGETGHNRTDAGRSAGLPRWVEARGLPTGAFTHDETFTAAADPVGSGQLRSFAEEKRELNDDVFNGRWIDALQPSRERF